MRRFLTDGVRLFNTRRLTIGAHRYWHWWVYGVNEYSRTWHIGFFIIHWTRKDTL